jgi:glycosyltransferase involved in cell wall biosynthesis
MKISVITVVFNNKDTISDTIASVASQTHPNVEHIIVDGLSTDGTSEIIAANRHRLAKVISERDSGIYDAMNKGIMAASGDIIGFLNADDIYNGANVLADVAAVFQNVGVEACHGDLVYVKQTDLKSVVRYWKSSEYHAGLFGRGWSPPHPTFYARKTVYEKYGSFNLKYRTSADYELMLRFLEKFRVRSEYIPSVMVRMRLGGVSNRSLANIIRQNREVVEAWRDNGLPLSIPVFFINKLFNRLSQFIHKT